VDTSSLGNLEEFTAGAGGSQPAALEPAADQSHLSLQETLPEVQYSAQALQAQLLELLEPHNYSFTTFR
jgi:hypothetical protein